MQHSDVQCSSCHNDIQHFSNISDNFVSSPQQINQYEFFDEAGCLRHLTPFTPAQEQSLHSDFMHMPTHHHQAPKGLKSNPPALQTQNLGPVLNYREDSHNLGNAYSESPLESPNTQLSTPTTPARSSFYANGSAAERMTSFSPSSNTSGEADSPRSQSPNRGQTSALEDDELDAELLAETKRFNMRMANRQPRRLWTHSLEKFIFTPHEIATLSTPQRRTIYSHSLEAHIDRIHSQLLDMKIYPIEIRDLARYKGLDNILAKSVVAGLQHDFVQVRTQILEIERATENARQTAAVRANYARLEAQAQAHGHSYGIGLGSELVKERLEGGSNVQPRKYSLDSSLASGPMPPPLSPHSAHI